MANPSAPKYANVPSPEAILAQPYEASLTDKALEKTFMAVAKNEFDSTVEASMKCARRCGNMYTASLYGGLASLIASIEPEQLRGKRISMFAFGSGLASSFFTIKVKGDSSVIREKLDLVNRLESMQVVPCQTYVDALAVSHFYVIVILYRKLIRSWLFFSSGKRTTMRVRTSLRVCSTTSGQARTTSRALMTSTDASTLASP